MNVLKGTVKYKEKKRSILSKDKLKTSNALKSQTVFPHSKSINSKEDHLRHQAVIRVFC
jgi:hypothetical protein